jgi:hypothetical protein
LLCSFVVPLKILFRETYSQAGVCKSPYFRVFNVGFLWNRTNEREKACIENAPVLYPLCIAEDFVPEVALILPRCRAIDEDSPTGYGAVLKGTIKPIGSVGVRFVNYAYWPDVLAFTGPGIGRESPVACILAPASDFFQAVKAFASV